MSAAPAPGTLRCPCCALPLEGPAHQWWSYRSVNSGRMRVVFECLAQEPETTTPGKAAA